MSKQATPSQNPQHHETQRRTVPGTTRLAALPALLIVLLLVTLCPSCSKPPEYLSADAKKGWKAYRKHCALCHNANPHLDSNSTPKGPPIASSTKELLQMRIKANKYPQGYKPKRATADMYPLPQALPDVPYLFAYLKEVRKGS